MSSSPAGDDPPLDDDVAPDDADREYSDAATALLVRDTPPDPRLTVLDGPVVDAGEPSSSSSASSRPGRLDPKLRRSGAVAPGALRRPAMELMIHRVALKESRNRTFFTAVRSVPRSDAGRDAFSDSIGSVEDGDGDFSFP